MKRILWFERTKCFVLHCFLPCHYFFLFYFFFDANLRPQCLISVVITVKIIYYATKTTSERNERVSHLFSAAESATVKTIGIVKEINSQNGYWQYVDRLKNCMYLKKKNNKKHSSLSISKSNHVIGIGTSISNPYLHAFYTHGWTPAVSNPKEDRKMFGIPKNSRHIWFSLKIKK